MPPTVLAGPPGSSASASTLQPQPQTNGFTSKSHANGAATGETSESVHARDPTYPVLRRPASALTTTPTRGTDAEFAFDAVEDALAAFARGEFLVVMDDEGRENEGDLIIAAEHVTTEKMAWMIRHSRCVRV